MGNAHTCPPASKLVSFKKYVRDSTRRLRESDGLAVCLVLRREGEELSVRCAGP